MKPLLSNPQVYSDTVNTCDPRTIEIAWALCARLPGGSARWGVYYGWRRNVVMVAMSPFRREERNFAPNLTLTEDRGRIQASGAYPITLNNYHTGSWIRDKIVTTTHSIERETGAVVADIMRRFWPVYLENHTHLVGEVRRSDQREYDTRGAVQTLTETLRAKPAREVTERTVWVPGTGTYGKFRVDSPDSVKVELHGIGLDAAIRVARLFVPTFPAPAGRRKRRPPWVISSS